MWTNFNVRRLTGRGFFLLQVLAGVSPVFADSTDYQSRYDAAVLADHPVMYLKMSTPQSRWESDLSGFGHGGKYHTRTRFLPIVATMPNGDAATRFDGTGQYLEVPDSDALSVTTTGTLTIEAWIRPDTLEFPCQESSGYVHWMGKGVAGSQEYVLRMYSLTNTEHPPRPNRISGYGFNLNGGLGSGAYFQDIVGIGEWIHVAVVISTRHRSGQYPTGYVRIFKNGALRKTVPLVQFDVIPGNGAAPFRVGTRNRKSYFMGAIGKVAVYDYELDLSQLAEHHHAMWQGGRTDGQ